MSKDMFESYADREKRKKKGAAGRKTRRKKIEKEVKQLGLLKELGKQ